MLGRFAAGGSAGRPGAFPQAFDPLSRILRDFQLPQVRTAAIRALARIDTAESAEFLVGLLEHGAPYERKAAADVLKRGRGARFVEAARAAVSAQAGRGGEELREILRARGAA